MRPLRRVLAQTRVEMMLTLRNGENLLAMVAIPAGVLVFFSLVGVLPGTSVHTLVPGVIALAVVSTAMVTLSIGTAFERQLGVLKRIGGTPLGRGGLLAAKCLSVTAVVALQCAALAPIGLALGWRPTASIAVLPLLALGIASFAGLGFLLAGTLRAEANLAVANALFMVMLFFGGVVVPPARLPGALRALAQALPVEPLATGLREGLGRGGVGVGRLVVLAAWALGACIAASLAFRWD